MKYWKKKEKKMYLVFYLLDFEIFQSIAAKKCIRLIYAFVVDSLFLEDITIPQFDPEIIVAKKVRFGVVILEHSIKQKCALDKVKSNFMPF